MQHVLRELWHFLSAGPCHAVPFHARPVHPVLKTFSGLEVARSPSVPVVNAHLCRQFQEPTCDTLALFRLESSALSCAVECEDWIQDVTVLQDAGCSPAMSLSFWGASANIQYSQRSIPVLVQEGASTECSSCVDIFDLQAQHVNLDHSRQDAGPERTCPSICAFSEDTC